MRFILAAENLVVLDVGKGKNAVETPLNRGVDGPNYRRGIRIALREKNAGLSPKRGSQERPGCRTI